MVQSGLEAQVLSGSHAKNPKPKTGASTTVASENSMQLLANLIPPIGMWRAPPKRKKPHSDKTSCALGAPPSMKIEPAYDGAVNRLFSVGVGFIFIAADFTGTGR